MLRKGYYELSVKMKTVATLAKRVELSLACEEEGVLEKQFTALQKYCENLFREWEEEQNNCI